MEHVLTTTNLFFPLLGVLGVVIGIVWNFTGRRLDKVEEIQKNRPFPQIEKDLAEIKTDIKWIKEILSNNKKINL